MANNSILPIVISNKSGNKTRQAKYKTLKRYLYKKKVKINNYFIKIKQNINYTHYYHDNLH